MRRAFTLVEMIMAMAAFSVLMTMLLQSLASIGTFTDSNRTAIETEQDIVGALDTLTDDLGNAAWFYPWDTTNGVFKNAPVFPAIYPAGTSQQTLASVTTSSGIVASPELWFVKLRTERLMNSATPSGLKVDNINFANSTATTLGQYNDLTRLPTAFSLVLNSDPATNANAFVAPVWESPASGLSFAANADPDQLRQFQYVLMPSATYTGLGRLVRRYRDPQVAGGGSAGGANSASWIDEGRTLIDGVESISFSYSDVPLPSPMAATAVCTAVPLSGDGRLGANQIRIDLVVHRFANAASGDAKGRTLRKLTHTVAMRSITNIGNE